MKEKKGALVSDRHPTNITTPLTANRNTYWGGKNCIFQPRWNKCSWSTPFYGDSWWIGWSPIRWVGQSLLKVSEGWWKHMMGRQEAVRRQDQSQWQRVWKWHQELRQQWWWCPHRYATVDQIIWPTKWYGFGGCCWAISVTYCYMATNLLI
jgi:hypothetical protein